MYSFLAPAVGVVITLMGGINSLLSARVGSLVAILFIHCAGLVAIALLCALRRERPEPGRLPIYFYLGGCVGVGTVFATIYAFSALGASLAVALALLGQILFSLVVDSTGFLGRKKYPFPARRLPSLLLVLSGIACMAGLRPSAPVAILLGLATGLCNGLSSILGSELGRKKGLLRSVRVNYVAGLSLTLLLLAIQRPSLDAAARAAAEAGPFLLMGGGLMGVAVVSSTYFIYPHLPAFGATLLVFMGQALAGLLLDSIQGGSLDFGRLLGLGLIIAGLGLDALLMRRKTLASRTVRS